MLKHKDEIMPPFAKWKFKEIFGKKMITNTTIIKGTNAILKLSRALIPFLKTKRQEISVMIIIKNAVSPTSQDMSTIPAIIDADKITFSEIEINKNIFEEARSEATFSPWKRKYLKRKKKKIVEKMAPTKAKRPFLAKNTAISLPVMNPEPTTPPTIAKKA